MKGPVSSSGFERHLSAFLALLVVLAVLCSPTQSVADDASTRAAELLLAAEAELDATRYQRAISASKDALRLDETLHGALVVQGLALEGLGRVDEAKSVLGAYLRERRDQPLDERVRPALLRLRLANDVRQGTLDPQEALAEAEKALLQLDLEDVRAYIDAIRALPDAEPEILRRALQMEALSYWYGDERKLARALWRQLFLEDPTAVVDAKLPPEALAAMAEEQAAAREAGAIAADPPALARTVANPPPADAVILQGLGGATAAIGFGLAAGSYARGNELYPGLLESGAAWDQGIDGYRRAWREERVGVVIGGSGVALLTAGLVRLIVDQAQKKKREATGSRLPGGRR